MFLLNALPSRIENRDVFAVARARACLLGETRLVFHAYFRSRYFCRCSPALRAERSPACDAFVDKLISNIAKREERGAAGNERAREASAKGGAKGTGRSRGGGRGREGGKREMATGSERSGNPGIGREAVEGDGRNKKFLAHRQVFLSFSPPLPRLISSISLFFRF